MTTTIRDLLASEDHVAIGTQQKSTVRLEVRHTALSRLDAAGVVDRAEFLAAVSAELGVLIINRDDLPKVNSTLARGLRAIHGPTGSEATIRSVDSADDVRGLALCYLAMAEHLAANPPVDAARVNALTTILAQATSDPDYIDIPDVARRLVRAGVRAPEETGR